MSREAEDADAARLVAQAQSGEREAFNGLYVRYFDRIFSYLRLVLGEPHEAEDATQHVFLTAFESLGRYELRGDPFRAWLFTIARNHALNQLRRMNRSESEDPLELDRRRERAVEPGADLRALEWVTDRDLVMFLERLPLVQRQVLFLRFTLDLQPQEVAAVLNRNPNEVRIHQHRALRFLRDRLAAVGRDSRHGERSGWQRRYQQARVLRNRRYVMSGSR